MPPPRIRFSSILSHLRNLRSNVPPRLNTLKSEAPGGVQRNAFAHILTVAKIFLAVHLTTHYIVKAMPTAGISMMPAIPHSFNRAPPILLVSMLHRRGRNIVVGDVIIYTHPLIPDMTACKRVVGMPGDYVCVLTPSQTSRDIESPTSIGGQVREEMIRVPEGHCWLAGDNLAWSRDSRLLGPVPLALVQGKALAVVMPWSERKWLNTGGLADVGVEEHGIIVQH